MNIKKITKNILLSLGIFLLAVVLSILFQKLEVGEHITIIFMFAVFLISLLTDGYAYGIISAIGGMLAVNYAFTYPYFALDFNIPVNLISAIIMTAVSILTGMLTTKIKNYEAEKAKLSNVKAESAVDASKSKERTRAYACESSQGRFSRFKNTTYCNLQCQFHIAKQKENAYRRTARCHVKKHRGRFGVACSDG